MQLFDGDFLGLATREKMAIEYASLEVNPANKVTYQSQGTSILQMMRETDFLEGAFYTLIAAFGSMTIVGDIWTYRLYKVFFALGTLGCVVLPLLPALIPLMYYMIRGWQNLVGFKGIPRLLQVFL